MSPQVLAVCVSYCSGCAMYVWQACDWLTDATKHTGFYIGEGLFVGASNILVVCVVVVSDSVWSVVGLSGRPKIILRFVTDECQNDAPSLRRIFSTRRMPGTDQLCTMSCLLTDC